MVSGENVSSGKERQGLTLKTQAGMRGMVQGWAEGEEACLQGSRSVGHGAGAAPCLSVGRRWVWKGVGGNTAQLAKMEGARLPPEQPVHLFFGLLPWRHEGPASRKGLR